MQNDIHDLNSKVTSYQHANPTKRNLNV